MEEVDWPEGDYKGKGGSYQCKQNGRVDDGGAD
jgi:hypothetical protein